MHNKHISEYKSKSNYLKNLFWTSKRLNQQKETLEKLKHIVEEAYDLRCFMQTEQPLTDQNIIKSIMLLSCIDGLIKIEELVTHYSKFNWWNKSSIEIASTRAMNEILNKDNFYTSSVLSSAHQQFVIEYQGYENMQNDLTEGLQIQVGDFVMYDQNYIDSVIGDKTGLDKEIAFVKSISIGQMTGEPYVLVQWFTTMDEVKNEIRTSCESMNSLKRVDSYEVVKWLRKE